MARPIGGVQGLSPAAGDDGLELSPRSDQAVSDPQSLTPRLMLLHRWCKFSSRGTRKSLVCNGVEQSSGDAVRSRSCVDESGTSSAASGHCMNNDGGRQSSVVLRERFGHVASTAGLRGGELGIVMSWSHDSVSESTALLTEAVAGSRSALDVCPVEVSVFVAKLSFGML